MGGVGVLIRISLCFTVMCFDGFSTILGIFRFYFRKKLGEFSKNFLGFYRFGVLRLFVRNPYGI